MSDRLFTQEELEESSHELDLDKQIYIAKYQEQIDKMDNLIKALDDYQQSYGRESNVYLDIIALKAQLIKNKEVIQQFQGII
tara:strand:+ start:28441 stop:28686 length:246 start_codon:yes stop_codon:yes gene_type:complete